VTRLPHLEFNQVAASFAHEQTKRQRKGTAFDIKSELKTLHIARTEINRREKEIVNAIENIYSDNVAGAPGNRADYRRSNSIQK
jgi:hypothetical protein